MKDPRDLSVVIVNFNTRNDLENCLTSVSESRQYLGYEVWVVDNSSTDGSQEMVKHGFPRVNLIENNGNLGFSKANNVALRQVRSPFILLLNPDTILFDHVFDDPVQFLKMTPDAGMVSCELVKIDKTLDLACRRSFPSAFDGFCRGLGRSKMFPDSHL